MAGSSGWDEKGEFAGDEGSRDDTTHTVELAMVEEGCG